MALLLIVLVGLFVLRRNVGGAFGLARLLWKQVRWRFSLALVRLNFNFFSKGIIWLVLGSAIEIPPLVSLASLSLSLCVYTPFTSQVFTLWNWNGNFLYSSIYHS